jgi:hypothetical protein
MQMHGYEQAAIIGKLSPRHEGIILEKEATGR